MSNAWSKIILVVILLMAIGLNVNADESQYAGQKEVKAPKIPPLPDLRSLGQFLPKNIKVGEWSLYILTASEAKNKKQDMFYVAVDSCNEKKDCQFDIIVTSDKGLVKHWLAYGFSTVKKEILGIHYVASNCKNVAIDMTRLGKSPEIEITKAEKTGQKTEEFINTYAGKQHVKWFELIINQTSTFVALNDKIKPLQIVKAVAPYHELELADSGDDWQKIQKSLNTSSLCKK